MGSSVLLIEGDSRYAAALERHLRLLCSHLVIVGSGDCALAQARESSFDFVIVDWEAPGLGGSKPIEQICGAQPNVPFVVTTGSFSARVAIEVSRLGADGFLVKPFQPAELVELILRVRTMGDVSTAQRKRASAQGNADRELIGSSSAMRALYSEIGRACACGANVLIRGDTGTGKELVARAIHRHSCRSGGPFVAVNCAAIPEGLLETELFGHERGSFTGAHSRRIGRFEQAIGGTIFLDEIGDLSPSTQIKLLRVLEEKRIRRLGGDELIATDARIVTATHRDVEKAIEAGQFREDLFYRLSAFTIWVPPLRRRREDIPDLVKELVWRCAADTDFQPDGVEPEALDFLQQQPWPGNVRQLESVIRQAVLLARSHVIELVHVSEVYLRLGTGHLPGVETPGGYILDLLDRAQHGYLKDARAAMIDEMDRRLFAQAIQLAEGNQAKAARWLGVTRTTVRQKLEDFALRPSGVAPTRLPDRSRSS